jgi:Mg-chelatase subunit ChlD
MTLAAPLWLLLALPLGIALWVWRPASRLLLTLRAISVVLVLLALAGFAVLLPSRHGVVVVVCDRSASMPSGSDDLLRQAVNLIRDKMSGDDELRLVTFGRDVVLEPLERGVPFNGFQQTVQGDGSSLGEAIETALGLIPPGSPGRIVVLSDGRWTANDPAAQVAGALARNIAIDFRAIERAAAGDLAIARIDAPSLVSTGESFLITAWVQSPEKGTVRYKLRRGDELLATGQREVVSGMNRFSFRDRATQPGNQAYVLEVEGTARDPVPENNQAKLLVGVSGPKPLLHLAPQAKSGLNRILRAGGLDVRQVDPGAVRWRLEDLDRYSGLILENVPAEKIGEAGMQTIAAWVRETGAGLMMTGGQRSYGPGGYYKSPLEEIMPVSMELRNEHRKLSLAIVVALDRSGSMAAPAGAGRTKMDLANLGTASVLDLLGPMDEFGCLAVDTTPHLVAPLGNAEANKAKYRTDILRIQSMGGGIYVDEALKASSEMLLKAKAGTKHIILFSDAADSEQPGDYKRILELAEKAGITVSVIGLGSDRDKDGDLLKDVAKRGRGRIFFTERAEELPRLFAQDTFVVARNTFIDEPTGIQHLPSLRTLTDNDFPSPKGLGVGGYNLCYLRPEAAMASVTLDEYKAPLTASWRAGAGRVLCYTGEADGKYLGPMGKWDRVGDYFTSLARWTAGPANPLRDGMMLTQDVREGVARIQLHLDPERARGDAFRRLPNVRILRSTLGQVPQSQRETLRWTGADTLSLNVALGAGETVVSTVEIENERPISLPPVCLPYSPEFKPGSRESGQVSLERLARATGGIERLALGEVWRDLPRQFQQIPLARWLLLAAVALWLLEVLDRRTSVLSNLLRRKGATVSAELRDSGRTERAATAPRAKTLRAPSATPLRAEFVEPEKPTTPEKPTATEDKGSVLAALRKARRRLDQREG